MYLDAKHIAVHVSCYKDKKVRAIGCPTGECVFIPHKEIETAYEEIGNWGLFIADSMQNQ